MTEVTRLFSRAELLGGLPARRAASTLFAVENRTARLVVRSRRACERYVSERAAELEERSFLQALAEGREPPLRPSIQDIERAAEEWAPLIPADPSLRAAVAHQLGRKYRFRQQDSGRLRVALGLDELAVAEAHERLFSEPLDAVFARRLGPAARSAWARSRVADRLERLPPFWSAFALTLTETVGAGVLALPIALAGVGVLPALALLFVFGLVNLVTIAAVVESINRSGSIRYGTTYFGRLVEDYLGPSGRVVMSIVLFAVNGLGVISYVIDSVVRCIEMGATDYLPKPFDPAILEARIRASLAGKRLHDLEVEYAERQAELLRTIKRQKDELSRFLSPQVAGLVSSAEGIALLAGHRREATSLFCDLRGFTPFSEAAGPEEVMGVLREYHAAMGALIVEYGGTLEHFAGDGMMVFFNDPLPQADHVVRAVGMAIAMRRRFENLAASWRERGYELGFGIGIATGYATLGRIGFEGRYDYGMIGMAVIIASRLSSAAADGQILLSPRSHDAVADLAVVEPVGDVQLKGLSRPMSVVNVVGLRDASSRDRGSAQAASATAAAQAVP